jgi:hypothetical protein
VKAKNGSAWDLKAVSFQTNGSIAKSYHVGKLKELISVEISVYS